MSRELVFYTNPQSRGRVVRWMLEEVGAPYRTELLQYGTTMKAPDYLAINPMGKVPAIRHGDVVVTEGAAICAYLADAFPEAGLAPPPAERGAYYRWLFFAAAPFEAAVTNRNFGFEVPKEKEMTIGYGTYGAVMDTLEGAVKAANAGTGYLASERFSVADLYVGSHIGFGLDFGIFEERPGFAEYATRVRDRDAYRRADELDAAAAAESEAAAAS